MEVIRVKAKSEQWITEGDEIIFLGYSESDIDHGIKGKIVKVEYEPYENCEYEYTEKVLRVKVKFEDGIHNYYDANEIQYTGSQK